MKKFLFPLLFLLLLAGITAYFLYRFSPSTLQKAESQFKITETARISRIVLSNTEGQRIELTQKNGQWLVNGLYEPNEEALSLLHELGDQIGAAWSINHLGDVARDRGDLAEARRLYQEGADTFRRLGEQWGMARSSTDLGYLACDQPCGRTNVVRGSGCNLPGVRT